MKKSVLGGIIFFCLLLASALIFTIFAGRLSSEHRLRQYGDAFGVIGTRVDALEKQRLLLEESAAALERQATEIRRRSDQIGAEIGNLRTLMTEANKEARAPFYSWRGFHITTASGLIVIAFLVFVWMLYTAVRERPGGEGESEPGATPVPGSVLEEEFRAAGSEETPPLGEAQPEKEGPVPPGGEEGGVEEKEERSA